LTALFALVRAAHFACLMTVFGGSALLWRARRIAVDGEALRRPTLYLAVAAAVTALLWLGFAAQEIAGDAPIDLHQIAAVATQSFYGKVFVWRLLLLVALCAACVAGGRHALKALLAGAALALLGLTSHAAAAGDARYELARAGMDALHLLTAGLWLGGLAVLLPQVLARPRDGRRLAALLRLFSSYGALSVLLLLAAGTFNAVAILDAPMRWSATYVTLLAAKIVLAAVMVALALTNRFGVLPGVERGEAEALDTIPLTVVAELVFAVLIVLIVGFLGLTAPMQM
jgi:putative copper resistance protein D